MPSFQAEATDLLCPPRLSQAGLRVSLATAEDVPALRALYVRHRRPEFVPLGLPEAQLLPLLEGQFRLQMQQYAQGFEHVRTYVLREDADIAGRLMLGEANGDMRILDILVAPERRGQGIGGAIIAALQQQAGRSILLHVAKDNPARRLYERLGFRVTENEGLSLAMAWSPTPQAFA